MSAKGRPEHEYRSAQHGGSFDRAKGRPEHEYRSAQREGSQPSPIPFLDLAALHQALAPGLDAAWRRVLTSNRLILGPELEAFEHEFAAYCGAAHCVGVGNGLDALTLILRALGVGPGDEVIVPAHTYIASWLAVTHAGATPVPVEPDPHTANLDPTRAEAAISARTRAIMPVHLYGQPADMTAIGRIAERHRLAVVEDAAQAHGARWAGRRAGTLGTAAGFSFYPSKNLGALGDGGAVVTDDPALAERVRRLRNYGSDRRYHHRDTGVNSRLDELQAALLRVKLPWLDEWNTLRRTAAARYCGLLADAGVTPPAVDPRAEPVWHLFVIRSPARDALQARLRAAGVETLIHYPVAPHRQPAYRNAGFAAGAFPNAERLADEVLSLPIWPTIAADQQQRVCAVIRAA